MAEAELHRGGAPVKIEQDVLRWYGRAERCRKSEDMCGPLVTKIMKEPCYYLSFKKKLYCKDYEDQYDNFCAERFLREMLGEGLVGTADCHLAANHPTLHDENKLPNLFLVEIGPRLRHRTPWCTNVVSVTEGTNVALRRIERSHRYLVTLKNSPTQQAKEEVINLLKDPILEEVYEFGELQKLPCFDDDQEPQEKLFEEYPLLREGPSLLQKISDEKALGFDDNDIDNYYKLFTNILKRNPTNVELFDLAQSNSEHSRHWFFNGLYFLDDVMLPHSLMDLVKSTNDAATTNQNNVIKFHDNSSGITGFIVPVVEAENPAQMSRLKVRMAEKHLILTAETHNFPTGVCPFSGAATGTGGRIRDVMAAGRGGTVVAAAAGYCVGQLNLPGYDLQWETDQGFEGEFEFPAKIILDASNGASDYGNKFGEPVILGFFRAYGITIGTEHREWVKPIMFSSGIGLLDDLHKDKVDLKISCLDDMVIGKIGGPAYRIGMGGGSASSAEIQGGSQIRTQNAVQRGDPEMGNKLNRVVRACIELGKKNPILSIHDQGAGGNANVLKEIVNGAGAVVYAPRFSCGDPTLQLEELWCAEYQESNAILYLRANEKILVQIADRERCKLDAVGTLNKTGNFILNHIEQPQGKVPVSFPLHEILEGGIPKKTYIWTKNTNSVQKEVPVDGAVSVVLKAVLSLPSVASKKFLTSKVDRSVTGLIAQQQCVGRLQVPLADMAVTACSFFSTEGIATSIGEKPILSLVDPAASARMSLMEALASIVMAPITCLKDVKCSVNWMWPAKLEGEGHQMYSACVALTDYMKLVGVAVDGGKDSLSMAAKVYKDNDAKIIKAPGTVVVSAYAPCIDITKVVTPDLKGPIRGVDSKLLWVRPVAELSCRMGGSAVGQVNGCLGTKTPDVTEEDAKVFVQVFAALQELIKERKVLSCHDISEGGLVTCVLEMAVAGCCGATLTLPDANQASTLVEKLFAEELGWVLEISLDNLDDITEKLQFTHCLEIGESHSYTDCSPKFVINLGSNEIFCQPLDAMRRQWETTSHRLELLQTDTQCAKQEYRDCVRPDLGRCYEWKFKSRPFLTVEEVGKVPSRAPWVAVLREEGTNGDREMAAGFIMAGFNVYDVTMNDLYNLKVDLDKIKGIAFPGGFSYAGTRIKP